MTDPFLSVHNLTVTYDERVALRDVSIAARSAAITALIGPNGAGKSTLLKTMLGLSQPISGTVMVGGRNIMAITSRERARLLAYVPQRSRLEAAISVENVVASGRFAHRGALARLNVADRDAINAALVATDSVELSSRRFDRLSCGEQQRVLLARALATGAPAILLDEPTAALDVGHALAHLSLLRRLAIAGRCIVVVLHQLDEVSRCADAAILLHLGTVLASGSPSEVMTAANLRIAYGVEPVAGGALGFRLAETRQ